MQVVDVDHAFDGLHAGANLGERNAARRAFEKNIQCLANDAEAGPEDERGDEQREGGIDPVVAGEQNARAAGNDRRGRKRVAGHVQKSRAQIHVAGHAPQQSRNHAIHYYARGSHDHHQPRLDRNRRIEPVDGFDGYPDGNGYQRSRVDECGQHAGPLIAEGLRWVGGAGLIVDRNKAEQQGQKIGEVVARFGEQRQRVSAQPSHEGDCHVSQRGHQRKP